MRLHVFADEAGNFDFRTGDNINTYFVVCTVVMPHCAAANDLLDLRRALAWDQVALGDYFHCTTDAQIVRDAVFELIQNHEFSVQATIMEKRKAMPAIRQTDAMFYKNGWFRHFQFGMPGPLSDAEEVHVTTASIGTKRGQVEFTDAVRDVIRQTVGKKKVRTNFWPCGTDPCLQLTDYCTWAIQRKWERGDTRAYDLIKDRITYEFDLFRKGTTFYY